MNLKIRKILKGYEKQSYVKPESQNDTPVKIDCSLGVNPFGCSESVKELDRKLSENISPYPPYPYTSTKEAIAEYWNLSPKNVRLYCGSILALDGIARVFVGENDRVLGFTPQFVEFIGCVKCMGGIYEAVDMREHDNGRFCTDMLLDALTDEHVMVYIDNPNNPTGQVIPLADIEKVVAKAAEKGISVLVDEAYGDFMTDDKSAANLLKKYDNLIVARSFSKGFGLAGMRVGFVLASQEIIDYCELVSFPFTVTPKATLLAEQALRDREFLDFSRREVAKVKKQLLDNQKTLTCMITDPETPIMALRDPKGRNLFNELAKRGVLTEAGSDVGLDDACVRLRVPTDVTELLEIINSL